MKSDRIMFLLYAYMCVDDVTNPLSPAPNGRKKLLMRAQAERGGL
jgi:hypothetical protein